MRKVVLVIDNEADIIEVVNDVLDTEGYTTVSCQSLDEAKDALASHHVDLVLTDVLMLGESGIDLHREMQVNPHQNHIPMIFMTGVTPTPTDLPGAVLAKPFSLSELLETVHVALGESTASTCKQ